METGPEKSSPRTRATFVLELDVEITGQVIGILGFRRAPKARPPLLEVIARALASLGFQASLRSR